MSGVRDERRVDGRDKATGRTRYVEDVQEPGMWHGAVVRADRVGGPVREVELDPGDAGCVLVTAADVPGENAVPIVEADMPCLARERVRYAGEPVGLVAAPDRDAARRAAARARVRIGDPSPGDEDPGERDVIVTREIVDGDPEAAFAACDAIVEGTYRTGAQEHAYLETQAMIAEVDAAGIRVTGSMQCPYYVRPAVASVMGVADDRVVVRQAPTGGAFGGKEDVPSHVACHAALLARAAGRPVKLVLDRREDMAFTSKRHPCTTRLRTGVMADGRFVVVEADVELEAGAYVTLTPVVLARCVLHVAGPYGWEHARIRGRAVRTDLPPSGAFRGFGGPQVQFAAERHVDAVAARLGMPAVEIRRRNLLGPGDRLPTGQVLDESVGAAACLESVVRRSEAGASPSPGERLARGVGFACSFHGAGFVGNGERDLASRVRLRLDASGEVTVLASTTEMGQGASTVLGRIAAERLGIAPALVRCPLPDTSRAPDSGPTVASRSTMIVGRLVERACDALREEVARPSGAPPGERPWTEEARAACASGPVEVEVEHEVPAGQSWDDETYRGDAYPAYSWGAAAVEVDVDRETFEVTPRRVVVACDAGRVVHETAARGQVVGGTVQALGWALTERLGSEAGRWREDRLQTYIVPTSADAPPVDVEILEIPTPHGPGGAKGLGELPVNAVAPAVANAVADALGVGVDEVPVTPERLFEIAGGRRP